jgi:hypothetical protein
MLAGILTPTDLPYHLGTRVLYLAVDPAAGRFLRLKLVSEIFTRDENLPITSIPPRSPVSSCTLLINFPAASS